MIAVSDEWDILDWSFHDEAGKVGKEKLSDWTQAKHNFFQATVNDAYARSGIPHAAPDLSRGETDALRRMLDAEVRKLNDFFSPKKEEPSSSLPNSEGPRINFSQ